MENKRSSGLNRPYLTAIILLTIIFPLVSIVVESAVLKIHPAFLPQAGKWFIFWAVGVRLFVAGLRQIFNPSFTARTIFHIENSDSLIVVRELGFANTCAGITGVLSIFFPEWRIVSAVSSGLYYGLAAWQHVAKKPAGANEAIALVSDIFIFLCLAGYVVIYL